MTKAKLLSGLTALITIGLLSGCGGGSGFTASGTILVSSDVEKTTSAAGVPLRDYKDVREGATCVPKPGFSDMSSGTQVTIKSSSGETLGFGSLSAPKVSSAGAVVCQLTFKIEGIPIQENDIYTVSTGKRGELNYKRAELESGIVMTLGG